MFDRASEYFAHFAVTFILLIIGSVCGAMLISWPTAYLAMHYIGNPTDFLSYSQMFAVYGVATIVLVHFATRGWWFNKSLEFIQEMEDLHHHQMARLKRKG